MNHREKLIEEQEMDWIQRAIAGDSKARSILIELGVGDYDDSLSPVGEW